MRQRREYLAAAAPALPRIVLDNRVTAGEAVLVAAPLEHPLASVPLFPVNLAITFQPAIDGGG